MSSFEETDYAFGQRANRRNLNRTAAIAITAIVHVALLWMLLLGIHPSRYVARVSEISVTVLHPNIGPQSPPPPPIKWAFDAPEDVEVPEPKFVVLPDPTEPPGIISTANQILPPRPDPKHFNTSPDPPPGLGKNVAGARLILALDVLPDGSIAEGRVVKTSGDRDADQIAIIYVKDNWRFLPAYRAGQPIEAWMYVQVRFGTG